MYSIVYISALYISLDRLCLRKNLDAPVKPNLKTMYCCAEMATRQEERNRRHVHRHLIQMDKRDKNGWITF